MKLKDKTNLHNAHGVTVANKKPHPRAPKRSTSEESHRINIAKDLYRSQEEKVLKAIQEKPDTSRALSARLGIERTNITRTLRNLELQGKIHKTDKVECEVTGRAVYLYSVKEIDEIHASTGDSKSQTTLFKVARSFFDSSKF